MRKPVLAIGMISVLLFPSVCFGQESEISVFKDNKNFFTEYKTIIQDGRLMFSLKDIGRLVDGHVTWEQSRNTAVISTSDREISFTLGQDTVQIEQDGQTDIQAMGIVPAIVNDRMYVPARLVSELSDYKVSWDSQYHQVFIETANTNRNDKKIPIRIVKEADEAGSHKRVVSPSFPVRYSRVSQNLEEVISYIRENIDNGFDIKNFEVETNTSGLFISDEEYSTSIRLNLKSENVIFQDGYTVNINNGFVDTVFITGNPSVLPKAEDLELAGGIDPEWLIDLALENTVVPEGYHIVEQTIYEKYDTAPYYRVRIDFESSSGFGYIYSYDYRIE